MTSLILGLISAVFAVMKNFFNVPYVGVVSFAFGIAAWISGDKILDKEPRNRAAFIGRMIGVLSTIFAVVIIGLVIRALILANGAS